MFPKKVEFSSKFSYFGMKLIETARYIWRKKSSISLFSRKLPKMQIQHLRFGPLIFNAILLWISHIFIVYCYFHSKSFIMNELVDNIGQVMLMICNLTTR